MKWVEREAAWRGGAVSRGGAGCEVGGAGCEVGGAGCERTL